MILKANLNDDILTAVYINIDKKEIHTMDGKDISFSKVCRVDKSEKDRWGRVVFEADKEINPEEINSFIPGKVYEFFEFGELKWTIYYPTSFEDDSKGLFKYAGINLYEGIAKILQLDIDEDKKYILCKDFIDRLDKLADVYEETAYKVYSRDGLKRLQKIKNEVNDLDKEVANKMREQENLNNRSFSERFFNKTNFER